MTKLNQLEVQNSAFETLTASLRRLHPALHHLFLARTLTVVLDIDDLYSLPTSALGELLFGLIDAVKEPKVFINLQNIMTHFTLALQGSPGPDSGGWIELHGVERRISFPGRVR